MDPNSGGMLVLVQKSFVVGWLYDVEHCSPGRIYKFDAWCPGDGDVDYFIACDFHNFGLSSNTSIVCNSLRKSFKIAKDSSLHNTFALVGDYKLQPDFAQTLKLDSPDKVLIDNSSLQVPLVKLKRAYQAAWENISQSLTKIEFQEHSNVNITTTLRMRLIDCSFPPPFWSLALQKPTWVFENPKCLCVLMASLTIVRYGGLSRLDRKCVLTDQGLGRFVASTLFPKYCHEMFSQLDMNSMHTHEAIDDAKANFGEAAGVRRDHCFDQECNASHVKLAQPFSIPRCVWYGNLNLARRAHANCHLGFFFT